MASPRDFPLWLKILLNICGPIGVGLALQGIVNAALGILFLAAAVCYVGWELHPGAKIFVQKRKWVSLSIFLIVGLILGLCAWLLVSKGASTVHNQAPPTPIIEASFDLQSKPLPFDLPPGESILAVVFLNNPKMAQMTQFTNTETTEFQWPFKAGNHVLQFADVLTISNHSDKHVFNLVIPLTFMFQKEVQGQNAITIASNQQEWTIDGIAPGHSSELYFIAEAHNVVITKLPQNVSLEIEGQVGRKTVLLRRRKTGILDELPITSGPSLYDWSGGTPKPYRGPME